MIYFKDTHGGVYAYPKTDLEQVNRLNELEVVLVEKENAHIAAKSASNTALTHLDALKEKVNGTSGNELAESELLELNEQIKEAESGYILCMNTVLETETEYHSVKNELDFILPVFFEIRESLKTMKKMNAKEVDAHLNPPISKEQLIQEVEQRKQLLLVEASGVITPLQYAVDLGIATDKEAMTLNDWKKYSVYLSRVDPLTAPDIDWPEKP